MIEKMWAYGRYLFISATRPDGSHALYTLVGRGLRLMWPHNMANENIQMITLACACRRPCRAYARLLQLLRSLMEDLQKQRKKALWSAEAYIYLQALHQVLARQTR